MARIFATKIWRWHPDKWAVLGFSREGVRNKVAAMLKPDDLVLFIGTKGEPTAENDQGRILGLARLDSAHVSTRDLVHPDLWDEDIRLNGGVPKWPYALPYVQAWTIDEAAFEDQLLPRLGPLGIKLATNVVELTEDEAARVQQLKRQDVTSKLYESTARSDARRRADFRTELVARKNAPTIGPTPSTGRRISEYRDKAAFVYVMELYPTAIARFLLGQAQSPTGHQRLCKVGWSYDPRRRWRQFNKSFPKPGNVGWKLVDQEKFRSASDAYFAEQRVLTALRPFSQGGEFVLCSRDEIRSALNDAISHTLARSLGRQQL